MAGRRRFLGSGKPMQTWHRMVTAAVLLGMGIAIAWPFRNSGEPRSAGDSSSPVLALRRPARAREPTLADTGGSTHGSTHRDAASQAAVEMFAEPPSDRSSNPRVAVRPAASTAGLVAARPDPRPAMAGSFREAVGPRHDHRDLSVARRVPLSEATSGAGRTMRRHAIRDGDTLESISRRYYGDARFARFLFQRNRDVLSRPDLLPLGAKLRIPPEPTATALSSELRLVPVD